MEENSQQERCPLGTVHLLLNHKVVKRPGVFLYERIILVKNQGGEMCGFSVARVVSCKDFRGFWRHKTKELASHIQSASLVNITSGLAPGYIKARQAGKTRQLFG